MNEWIYVVGLSSLEIKQNNKNKQKNSRILHRMFSVEHFDKLPDWTLKHFIWQCVTIGISTWYFGHLFGHSPTAALLFVTDAAVAVAIVLFSYRWYENGKKKMEDVSGEVILYKVCRP